MSDPLATLEDAVAALREAWAGTDAAAAPAASLDRAHLVAVTNALGVLGRRLDAIRMQVAAEVEHESRRELGADSLAKQQGFRTAAALLSATLGASNSGAIRLMKVGQAVTPRIGSDGRRLPPLHPHVAAALSAGTISVEAAGMIVTMLDRVAPHAAVDDCDRAERALTAQAVGLSVDDLRKVVSRAEASLEQDSLEPTERERHARRSLRMYERDGMLHLDGVFDAATAAPLRTAVETLVTAGFRAAREGVIDGDDNARPTVAHLQADALIQLAEHALSCRNHDLPLDGATVIVRMNLESLREGIGSAEIDGVTQLFSPATARHLAASANIIPCLLDTAGEVLNWGRKKRLFTMAQKLALVERDGGCAMCNLPPGMTKAHHLKWWARDAGPTDLCNAVLLCESCHHRIHDNGWDIRIEGGTIAGRVWFIPPRTVDPARAPRLGGRARFDFTQTAIGAPSGGPTTSMARRAPRFVSQVAS